MLSYTRNAIAEAERILGRELTAEELKIAEKKVYSNNKNLLQILPEPPESDESSN